MTQMQQTVTIESIDFEGKGVAKVDGKTVFVKGALPQEEVIIEIVRRKANFDTAKLIEIITPSPKRVTPDCPNFTLCGGCSLQHIEFKTQVEYKQQTLMENLQHIGNVTLERDKFLPPLYGKPWEYRQRARLSAKNVDKKGGLLVGFRENGAPYVVDMNECLVLPKHISNLIPLMRQEFVKLSIKTKLPQIEVAVGDRVSVLVLRNMEEITAADEEILTNFVEKYSTNENPLQIWLQPKGPETCYPFYPLDAPQLSYSLGDYGIEMPYYPSEFTQVNTELNNKMVNLALELLAPQAHELIADFFCGIGNFTLPIAKNARQVIGIEGSDQLVKRARQNALHNNLGENVSYQVCNLFKIDSDWLAGLGKLDKWLIDPPRDGAYELVKSITKATAPMRIVYVSCNPSTLARDAGVLVNDHGYKLIKCGVMNMFPHTTHVESIALFERDL